MHFEQFIEKSNEDLQVHLNSIQQLYWALNEPDGVVGVAAVRKCPASLYEETLEHESAGSNTLTLRLTPSAFSIFNPR